MTTSNNTNAKFGLVLPGLGHLLQGKLTPGIGMLSLLALLGTSAVAGFSRLGSVMFSGQAGSLSLHAVIALIAWVSLAAGLWYNAYRLLHPRVLSDEERNSNKQIFLRQLGKHRTGMIGLFGVLIVFSFAFLTPFLAPFDPTMIDAGPKNLPPGDGYLMGTDKFGRDVLSRLLHGTWISLSIGMIAVSIAATIGTTVGAVAGYFGGAIDRGMMWFTDLLLSMPRLILLITIAGLFRAPGVWKLVMLVVILGCTAWMGVSRIVRSQVLSLSQQEFVQAARALGMSDQRIVFRHIIPNALAPVIVYCSLAIGSTILAEASLSFLGLGVAPPTATWGVMVNDAREVLRSAPWTALFPGFAIVFTVMSFNLFGDGLRDALDPKLKE